MSLQSVARTLRSPQSQVALYTVAWALFVALHPAAASAQDATTTSSTACGSGFTGLCNTVHNFKEALKYVSTGLVVIGLIASATGWMMRSHEGLGPVFWGGITMVGAGSLVLLGDSFIDAMNPAS